MPCKIFKDRTPLIPHPSFYRLDFRDNWAEPWNLFCLNLIEGVEGGWQNTVSQDGKSIPILSNVYTSHSHHTEKNTEEIGSKYLSTPAGSKVLGSKANWQSWWHSGHHGVPEIEPRVSEHIFQPFELSSFLPAVRSFVSGLPLHLGALHRCFFSVEQTSPCFTW